MTVRDLRPASAEALTRQQLAVRLQVAPRTVARWVAAGVPCERWGRRLVRFDPELVREWLVAGNYQGERFPREQAPDPDSLLYRLILRCDPCSYCGAPTEHIDHITPRRYGGLDDWTNLTAACRLCNARKHARPLLVFLLGAT